MRCRDGRLRPRVRRDGWLLITLLELPRVSSSDARSDGSRVGLLVKHVGLPVCPGREGCSLHRLGLPPAPPRVAACSVPTCWSPRCYTAIVSAATVNTATVSTATVNHLLVAVPLFARIAARLTGLLVGRLAVIDGSREGAEGATEALPSSAAAAAAARLGEAACEES